MKNYIKLGLLVLMGAGLISACAKSEKSSLNEENKYFLDAWMEANHSGVKPSGKGIYIIDDKAGKGEDYKDQIVISVDYTISDLEGNIQSTTSKKLAQQIGSYEPQNYYGDRIWVVTDESVAAGVEDMIKGMKVGGTRTAVIPSWLNVYKRYKHPKDYFKHNSNKSHSIYTVKLKSIIDDINQWECDSLKRYSEKYLGGIDTTSYGFYYKQLVKPTSTKEMSEDTTVLINYIGRRLDGSVFDTNIADTAKVYNIYSAERDYSPSKIQWGKAYNEIKMISNGQASSLIAGFQKTLWQMHPGEKGSGVFISRFGYYIAGSGQTIPSCCPLRFDIELVKTDK